MSIRALLLAFAICSAGSTSAQTLTGNQILEACSIQDGGAADDFCTGYTVGVVEGLMWGAGFTVAYVRGDELSADDIDYLASHMLGFCLPDTASNRQLRDVIVAHLIDNPETRHEAARTIVQSALEDNFPCI